MDRTTPSRRHLVVWTFASQGISSITNAGFTLLLARGVSDTAFGAFTIAFTVFTFVIGMVRASVTTPLLISHSASTGRPLVRASLQATGASLGWGLVASVLCAVDAAVVRGPVGAALLVLAAVMPAILVQDAWRQALFAAGRPRAAAINDAVWAVVQFAAIAALYSTGHGGVVPMMLVWGLGALAGALVGVQQVGGLPALLSTWSWTRAHRGTGARLGGEYLLNTGAFNLATFLLAGISGLVAAGALRAAQTLLGPLQTVFSAITSFAVPVLVRGIAARGADAVTRTWIAVSAVCAGGAALWGGALLLLPDTWGVQLLGQSWAGAAAVLLPSTLQLVALGAAVGPAAALKGMDRADVLLRVSLVQAPAMLGGGVLGAWAGGAAGAAWGFAVAQLVGAVLTAAGVSKAVRAHGRERSPVSAR